MSEIRGVECSAMFDEVIDVDSTSKTGLEMGCQHHHWGLAGILDGSGGFSGGGITAHALLSLRSSDASSSSAPPSSVCSAGRTDERFEIVGAFIAPSPASLAPMRAGGVLSGFWSEPPQRGFRCTWDAPSRPSDTVCYLSPAASRSRFRTPNTGGSSIPAGMTGSSSSRNATDSGSFGPISHASRTWTRRIRIARS